MADNVAITEGSGTTISADDIAGVKVQRVKVQYGGDGSATDVDTGTPLPVTVSGIATSAKQDTGNTSLASIDGKITAVNTGAVVVSSSALPSGAATAAAQTDKSQFTKLTDGTDTALVTAAGELNVLPTAQPGVDIGDVTLNNGSGAGAVNVQDGGNSLTVDYATTGSGTAAGALRVELPTNGTGVVGLNAGSAIIGKVTTDQTTHGTTDLVAADITKVAGAAISQGHGTAATAVRVELPTDGTGTVGLIAGSARVGQAQLTGGTTSAALGLGSTVTAYGNLRVTAEPTSLFNDPLDGSNIDTANRWNTPVAVSGMTVTQGLGNLTITTNTTNSASAYIDSIPAFAPLGISFSVFGAALKFEAQTANFFALNQHRFWGLGSRPGTFDTTTPLKDAIGFEIDITGQLNCVVYENGTNRFRSSTSLTGVNLNTLITPSNGFVRFGIAARADTIVFYINTTEYPAQSFSVSSASFALPDVQALPIRFAAVNTSGGTVGASTFQISTIGIGDTGGNNTIMSDGTYPWRKAAVSAAGALKVDGSASVQPVSIASFSSVPQPVNLTTVAGSDTAVSAPGIQLTSLAGPTGDPVDTTGSSLNVVVKNKEAIDQTTPGVTNGMAGAVTNGTGVATALNALAIPVLDVSAYKIIFFQLTGTWVGTFTPEGSDDGVNWVTVIGYDISGDSTTTGITGNSIYEQVVRFRYFRLRMSAYTSGTATAVYTLSASTQSYFVKNINAGGLGAEGGTVNSFDTIPVSGKNGSGNKTALLVEATGRVATSPGLYPSSTALNTYSAQITTNTTTTPTASTAYISTIAISVTTAGTTSTISIKDKQGTPLSLVSALGTAALSAGDNIFNFQTPVKMTSGIDIVTAGAAAATISIFIDYYQ